MRNARCVATGDPPFFVNSSTIEVRCSPNHTMVYIENGMYTAVRRRAFHHCRCSPPEAMTLPNWGVLSAAHCNSETCCALNNEIIKQVTSSWSLFIHSTLSLSSGLDWSEWSTPRPGRFTPGKETRYPLHRRLGGPKFWLEVCRKSRPNRDSIPGPPSP